MHLLVLNSLISCSIISNNDIEGSIKLHNSRYELVTGNELRNAISGNKIFPNLELNRNILLLSDREQYSDDNMYQFVNHGSLSFGYYEIFDRFICLKSSSGKYTYRILYKSYTGSYAIKFFNEQIVNFAIIAKN